MVSIEYVHKLLEFYNQLVQSAVSADWHPADFDGYTDVSEK